MLVITAKQVLKRSIPLVNIVRWVRIQKENMVGRVRTQKEKWSGGFCSNYKLTAYLAAFTPNTAGS
jgi:hypothetical protein